MLKVPQWEERAGSHTHTSRCLHIIFKSLRAPTKHTYVIHQTMSLTLSHNIPNTIPHPICFCFVVVAPGCNCASCQNSSSFHKRSSWIQGFCFCFYFCRLTRCLPLHKSNNLNGWQQKINKKYIIQTVGHQTLGTLFSLCKILFQFGHYWGNKVAQLCWCLETGQWSSRPSQLFMSV